MKENIGVVLIHGAGLGSFIWDEIIPLINLPCLAVDFPNRGEVDKVNEKLTFDDYTETVVEQIRSWHKERIILVVHSIGSCVGLKVAEVFEK